jgi:hypothetical protein
MPADQSSYVLIAFILSELIDNITEKLNEQIDDLEIYEIHEVNEIKKIEKIEDIEEISKKEKVNENHDAE